MKLVARGSVIAGVMLPALMVVLGSALIVLGGSLSLLNWYTTIATTRRGRFVSPLPFIGAVPLGVGMALIPTTRPYAWIALIADYGTFALIIALPVIAYDVWQTSAVNLVHAFESNGPGKHVHVKLFRNRHAEITVDFDPPVPCGDGKSFAISFCWTGEWRSSELFYTIMGYDSERELVISQTNGRFTSAETYFPGERTFQYDRLDNLTLTKTK